MQVHFGGRFVGTTFLGEKKAGEEFHLNLGVDREVKVKRERIRDKTKETFFGKVERDMAFKISLENLKDRPITIKVLDSIPISRTDKVEVKNVKITPDPTEKNYQDREGVFLWGLELKPGAKQEIAVEFVISYPKDQPVAGL